MRRTRKLQDLLALIRTGAGEQGIYGLAAAAGRPYRRVHDQVRRLAATGVVRLVPQRQNGRARTLVVPVVRSRAPLLSFNRGWSRPARGLDPETVLAQVLARPTFVDLIACVQHYGLEEVRRLHQTMVADCELSPAAATATARMLNNIEVGRARAAGVG